MKKIYTILLLILLLCGYASANTSGDISEEELQERRTNFLKSVATPQFANIGVWEKAAQYQNIDIDVWICIGYAETWLGRSILKESANNVGNVWNNDRWNKRPYETPFSWARAIFYALNNKYLWSYWYISQLSRYGNKKWKIYASSTDNWHNNVTRCLSRIKWREIKDYFFRLDEESKYFHNAAPVENPNQQSEDEGATFNIVTDTILAPSPVYSDLYRQYWIFTS